MRGDCGFILRIHAVHCLLCRKISQSGNWYQDSQMACDTNLHLSKGTYERRPRIEDEMDHSSGYNGSTGSSRIWTDWNLYWTPTTTRTVRGSSSQCQAKDTPGSMATGTGAEVAMYGSPVAGIVRHMREHTGLIHTMTTTATAGRCTKVTGIMRTTATTTTTIIITIITTITGAAKTSIQLRNTQDRRFGSTRICGLHLASTHFNSGGSSSSVPAK